MGDKYIPSQEKRWQVSEDEISRERLKTLKEIHDYFKEQVPGVTIAICLFGSLSKGKELNSQNANSSDIDVAVFIDYDELIEKFKKILEQYPQSEFVNYAQLQIEDFRLLYPKLLSLSDEMSKDFVKTILHDFVNDMIKKRFEHLQNVNMSESGGVYATLRPISLSGPESIMYAANALYKKQSGSEGEVSVDSVHVSRFFHLDVGGSMKKYRESFYHELAQLLADGGEKAKYAESLWRSVVSAMKAVERFEEQSSPELDNKFPSPNLREFLAKQKVSIPEILNQS